ALGGGEGLAWALHGTVMAAIALYVSLLWRSRAPFDLKAAALAVGVLLVTPYVFIYDFVILAVPMAFLVHAARTRGIPAGRGGRAGAGEHADRALPGRHGAVRPGRRGDRGRADRPAGARHQRADGECGREACLKLLPQTLSNSRR